MTVVEVWLIDTRLPFRSDLDPGEVSRRDAFRAPDDRRRFDAAHSAQRRILRQRLPEIHWSYGPNGKPFLTGAPLQVNLTHAGEWAAIAITATRPVGIDLQDIVNGLDHTAMARRFFPPEEADLVTRCGPELFARLWARKEAVVKAAGDRIPRNLGLPVAGSPPPIVDLHGVPHALADLEAPEGFRAAVALAGPDGFSIRTH
ncbi:4'-phosphopantetheinyl transferase family protein [Dactylosporangium sp. NPDC051541]|uniref:4'-phosphopantetheinyl transferase family protein n=1 Tax=Dactylosporangium sp. NPDC051541 TaxID=3363977 RepID=UPI0037AD9D70